MTDPPGAWFFYTYWCDMRSWQGPSGTSFYGNGFAPAKAEAIPRDTWQCVEFMVKANTAPDKSDGEQAFWLLYYMESVFRGDDQFKPRPGIPYNADSGTVWFDHVVVARKYIGPFRPLGGAKPK